MDTKSSTCKMTYANLFGFHDIYIYIYIYAQPLLAIHTKSVPFAKQYLANPSIFPFQFPPSMHSWQWSTFGKKLATDKNRACV